ncbi:inositol monophosphatase family protein [Saccharothrix violaceirubra]|uniref:Myo-inositol-1(Or 4)-monophosphatase n=1 Tax=Saccharothrix violaceirubra TaxID=413306 RepID=A0A7W7WZ71_9PSEU|nr:inositol monophosphatase family protein [Saccharothrix violaceirubra]MBB4968493.1 myo-inositol-1(or 4)-monophosphatase [Saccharothrix violaceirubra]
MKRSYAQLTEIAQKAVRIGGDVMKHARPTTVTEKSDRDSYTDVDLRIEQEVREYLAEATPEIGFIGEEQGRGGQAAQSAYVWLLDPIDGTANFVHGIPLCATQIALVHEGKPLVAAMSFPYLEADYWASQGHGAFMNGKKLAVSDTARLDKAIIAIGDYATGPESGDKNKVRLELTRLLAEQAERVRMFGSAAHDFAWLAEGRIDAAIVLSNDLVDIFPGVLIAQEAGASLRDALGNDHTANSSSTVGACPGISEQLAELLRGLKSA